MPGGFGVAKNLSTFAFEGSDGNLDSEVKRIIVDFHNQGKPIGAVCIAPAVLALALGKRSFNHWYRSGNCNLT